jgi:hypothetical protein
MKNQPIEKLDEALRLLLLDMEEPEMTGVSGIAAILEGKPVHFMSESREADLFSQLEVVLEKVSLGVMLKEAMGTYHFSQEKLSAETSLPAHVLGDLLEDKLYPNNVPIMIFRELLNQLHITFAAAESAILTTFRKLQDQVREPVYQVSSPIYRKRHFLTKGVPASGAPKRDGKELYENREALDKYLNRLKELLPA